MQLTCLMVLGLLWAQDGTDAPAADPSETVARERLAEAAALTENHYTDEAAAELHRASVAADLIVDDSRRSELQKAVNDLAKQVDKRLKKVREFERRAAADFVDLAAQLVKKKYPRTALVVLETGSKLDEATTRPASEEIRQSIAESESSDQSRKDKKRAGAFDFLSMTATVTPDFEDYLPKDREFTKYLKLREKHAKAAIKLAKPYQSAGMAETALSVGAHGARLYLELVRDDYGTLLDERGEVRAERRYERYAKPFMDAFNESNHQFGDRRKWAVEEKEIQTPPLAEGDALIVSGQEINGDYRLEVDFAFEDMVGTVHVVFAYESEDSFYTWEFERPRARTYYLRICHYAQGEKHVLAESDKAPQTLAGWHTASIDVEQGEARTQLGKAELICPISLSNEVSFGFFQPGDEAWPSNTRFRNIIIREL